MSVKTSKDKGFSLVELIIVVAILAILTGILVPAYIKYVDRSKSAVCAANIDEVVGAWQVATAEDNTKTLQIILDELKPECPSGGSYSISDEGGFQAVVCSVHGGEVTTGFEGTKTWAKRVYNSMLEFTGRNTSEVRDEIGKWPGNDNLMTYLKDNVYNGKWPEFDSEVLSKNGITNVQYIKSYINLKGKNLESAQAKDVVVFANAAENSGNWNTSLIYNPDDGQWYRGRSMSIANQSWPEIKAKMEANGWKPLEK